MFCRECGRELVDGAAFCQQCGKKVNTEEPKEPIKEEPDFSDSIDWEMIFDEIKTTVKGWYDKFKLMTAFQRFFVFLGVFAAAVFGVLILIALFRMIFSSAVVLIVVVVLGYIAYQRWGVTHITEFIYENKSQDLYLPAGMTSKTLLEALSGKFNYPYFKGVRYDEKGDCVIEGKYCTYTAEFCGYGAYLDCDSKQEDKRYHIILLEAMAIRSYINKFFNPTMPVNVLKSLNKMKSAELQRKMVSVVCIMAFILIFAIYVIESIDTDSLSFITKPGWNVRGAYLSQYSEDVTIEEAFDSYFDNGKWSTYDAEGYSYVVFTGTCEYLGERADIRVTFKLTGEHFIVDGLDVNGKKQNELILYALLSNVYKEWED